MLGRYQARFRMCQDLTEAQRIGGKVIESFHMIRYNTEKIKWQGH